MKTNAIILAAGQGTRMKSKHSKALQPLAGQSMIEHVLDMVEEVGFEKKIVVVGHEKESVISAIEGSGVSFAHQDQQLGTGHAVMMAQGDIEDDETVIILNCDTPLLSAELIKKFLDFHVEEGYDASLITTIIPNPFGYGRIIRDDKGRVSKIVEEKDATDKQREICEINSGIYVFNGRQLKEALSKLDCKNCQKEYYLTDCIGIVKETNGKIGRLMCDDSSQLVGINTKVQLAEAEAILRKRKATELMLQGVTITDPATTYIDKKVQVGCDTIILPNTHLKGDTVIGEECTIGPSSVIDSSKIGNFTKVENSTVLKSRVDENTNVGPYAYIRPGSTIGKRVKIGDFVEVKNSNIGDDTKVSHLTYIGDGDVGSNVNVGCGVVFVNYDGREKFRSRVGDNCFIGCNVNLISPVTIHDNSYVAAGSTITADIPSGSLAVARAQQINKEGWVEKKGLISGRVNKK